MRVRVADAARKEREALAAAERREGEALAAAESLNACLGQVAEDMQQREFELEQRLLGNFAAGHGQRREGKEEKSEPLVAGGRSVRATVQEVEAKAERIELWGRRLGVMEETARARERLAEMERVDKERAAARIEDETWKEGVVDLLLKDSRTRADSDGWSLSSLDDNAPLDFDDEEESSMV